MSPPHCACAPRPLSRATGTRRYAPATAAAPPRLLLRATGTRRASRHRPPPHALPAPDACPPVPRPPTPSILTRYRHDLELLDPFGHGPVEHTCGKPNKG
eukprot:1977546-Prymnesium_polylepis.1